MEKQVIRAIARGAAAGLFGMLFVHGASAANRVTTSMTVGATVTASCRVETAQRPADPSCEEASRKPQSIAVRKVDTLDNGASARRLDAGGSTRLPVLLIRF